MQLVLIWIRGQKFQKIVLHPTIRFMPLCIGEIHLFFGVKKKTAGG